ncbi:inosamine-phosphate amidinotransferase 1 [Streptomyces sp. HNM0574]|uniref:inosamine-phosphate amidinotransferase 1 n=1 Tax=Streptomyces sp. HNM0574 TaxID=2714954 RepID=UPI00146BA8A7|nr:inosamine-phosphate amidinotransferase 1 [Streptomyces sp. HNM0574]NLU69502.1 inosamine-phosphate amidinotransferase 1 [Streptomyces sp. HNM0574]
MSLVSVHNEWDPLEEVIVGIADGARVPSPDPGLYAVDYADDLESAAEIPTGPYDPRVVEEANEDLEGFVELLRGEGVTVRRPEVTDHSRRFGTPEWSADGEYNYCPRDVLLPIGETVIEAPMTLRSRYFEPFAYRDILREYFDSGAHWISAPKPRLPDATYNADRTAGPVLRNFEPVFDAANVLRLGRDILYQISCSGNEYGFRWLRRVLGDGYRVHPVAGVYEGTHLDTTITPVRPGLVVLNPERIREDQLPPPLQGWDIIWASEIADTGYTGAFPRGSVAMGMNFVMVSPQLAVVGDTQHALIRELERHGVTVAPLRMRHPRTLSGGFHCVSVDIRRRGTLQDLG